MICKSSGSPATARTSHSRQAFASSRKPSPTSAYSVKRRVAKPAEPVVPIARSAEFFRQRRRARRDNPAGLPVRQRLQGQQRSQHGVRPFSRRLEWRRPVRPEGLDLRQSVHRLQRRRRRAIRWGPAQDETNFLGRPRCRTLRPSACPRLAASTGVSSSNRSGPAVNCSRPSSWRETQGTMNAVVEAHDQFGVHRDRAAQAPDHAHDVRYAVAPRHEVDDADGAVLRFRMWSPGSACRRDTAASRAHRRRVGAISQRPWLGSPSSAAKQAALSNRGRPSQSIDPSRPTSADGLAIADDGIVFDTARHSTPHSMIG